MLLLSCLLLRPSFAEIVEELSTLLQGCVQLSGSSGHLQPQQEVPWREQQQFDGELTQPVVRPSIDVNTTEPSWAMEAPAVLPFFSAAPAMPAQAADEQQQLVSSASPAAARSDAAAAAAAAANNSTLGGTGVHSPFADGLQR